MSGKQASNFPGLSPIKGQKFNFGTQQRVTQDHNHSTKLAAMMFLEGKIQMCSDQSGLDSSLLNDKLVL
jgi:hypothetical protein